MMKTKLYNFVILLLLVPVAVVAGNEKGKYTKEKRITKTYLVNSNAGLDITNKYGNVYVTTWDEDKTSVEVLIKVSSNSEEQLDKRLNSIDVNLEGFKHLVTAKTTIGNFSGGKTNMEINYTIKIPRNGTIEINNQYGGIMLGKINGAANIICKYGDFTAEALNSEKNNINIEYSGGSKTGFIRNGNITAKYSGLNIDKAEKLSVNSEYSSLKITDVADITFNSDYGNLNIDNGGKITGVANYLPIRIARVTSQVNITTKYGNLKIGELTDNVRNVAINAAYTPIDLRYNENYAFDFDISLKYSKLHDKSGLKFLDKKENNTDGSYRGYHKNSGQNRVFVKSEYGHLNLIKL